MWRHQAHSLIKEKQLEKDIFDAIRSSLHGKAGSIVVRLGTEASITDILKKMDSVWRSRHRSFLLAALYSACQGPVESVSDWGCRLETLFDAAKHQATIPGNTDEVLHSVLWAGLCQELKVVSAYHFDTIRTFDELRTALHRIEKRHMKPSTEKMKSAACKSAQEQDKKSKEDKLDKAGYERLETMIQQMSTKFSNKIKGLRKEMTETATCKTDYGSGTPSSNRFPRGQHPGQYGRGRGGLEPGSRGRGHRQQNSREIVCFRCGEKVHVRIGCRMRIDHFRQQDF